MGKCDGARRGLPWFLATLFLLLATCCAQAQTASLVPNANQQFFNASGQPLAGGTVCFYLPNTTTPKLVWQDPFQVTPWTSPCITLNAGGYAPGNLGIFGSGNYRQQVFDALSNLIWDGYTTAPALSSGGGGASGAPAQVGCNNCGISAAAASSNITFTLTDQAGAPLSSTDQANACFSIDSANQTSVTCVNISAALTFTLNSGSTLGVPGTTQPFRVWLALFYNNGSPVLGTIVATNYTTASPSVISLNGLSTATTVTCASCASATSAQTWYTTAGLTSAFTIIGYAEFAAFVSSGHWVLPTAIHSCGPGCKRPGDIVQIVTKWQSLNDTGSSSASFVVFATATASITPTSAANPVLVTLNSADTNTAGNAGICAVVRGTIASTTIVSQAVISGSTNSAMISISGLDLPSTTSAQAYTVERLNTGASNTLCARTAVAATQNVQWILQEIMG
jgi:hypothetical protein